MIGKAPCFPPLIFVYIWYVNTSITKDACGVSVLEPEELLSNVSNHNTIDETNEPLNLLLSPNLNQSFDTTQISIISMLYL